MLKAVIITQNFPPETVGGATYNFEMADYLSKKMDIEVITSFPSYPYGEYNNVSINDNYSFKVTRIKCYLPIKDNPTAFQRIIEYASFSIFSFFELMKKRNVDIVITSQPPEFTLYTGFVYKLLLRKKWIIDIRDLWYENAINLGLIKNITLPDIIYSNSKKFMIKYSNMIVYTADTIIQYYKQKYNYSGLSLFNPNGIDPSYYPKKNEVGNDLVYVGNIGHAYNLKILIDALSMIDLNVKLYIRGGGDKKNELINYIKEKKMCDRVIFLDKMSRKELLLFISKRRIGICPLKKYDSLKSVIPTKVIEYMGCGIPFIGTGEGEIERLARESRAGTIVNNKIEMANIINTLYPDEKKCQYMGRKGRLYVEKYYNKTMIIDNLYEKIKVI